MKYANMRMPEGYPKSAGDYIQLEAIDRLYEYMGINLDQIVRISNKELFSYDGDDYLILPINFRFFGKYKKLSPKIIPVYLGISMINKQEIDQLRWKEFQPVGCRDYDTWKMACENGIEAYLNGCMTITLPKISFNNENDRVVYIIDISEKLLNVIPQDILKNAKFLGENWLATEERNEKDFYLEIQKNAKMVITGRLHAAAPCIAYGIPVILAQDNVSYRMNWIQKYIPVYSENDYGKIDWNPQSLEIEEEKRIILNNAVNMIKRAYEKHSYYHVSEIYEKAGSLDNTENEDIASNINWINNHWKKEEINRYVLWGITSTADELTDYIKKNYPNAELVGVIDLYNKLSYQGISSSGLSVLDEIDNNVTVFVTALRAVEMAIAEMSKRNHEKYSLCYGSLLKHTINKLDGHV